MRRTRFLELETWVKMLRFKKVFTILIAHGPTLQYTNEILFYFANYSFWDLLISDHTLLIDKTDFDHFAGL